MPITTLYWFTNDLRIHDNPSFHATCSKTDELVCAVVLDPAWLANNRYGLRTMGQNRLRFWLQSVAELSTALRQRGGYLHCLFDEPVTAVTALGEHFNVSRVAASTPVGWYENQQLQAVTKALNDCTVSLANSSCLFDQSRLPFAYSELPASYSRFRKQVEPLLADIAFDPLTAPDFLPEQPNRPHFAQLRAFPEATAGEQPLPWRGGEQSAQQHLHSYFSTDNASRYKAVRNELDGWRNSTKFSAWLANGSLGPGAILRALRQYEADNGSNDSTYWIGFELLWREYFQCYARAHGTRLFHPQGIKNKPTHTSYYPGRFKQWCQGNTPYSLVNACMKQLNQTGYMSNRGRQVVASCFVNEMGLDWRYGAAYFERQLVDYDVASNWGNWQYLAGVGCDPRGKRHFDINKQTEQYDPDGEFIMRWQGQKHGLPLDAVDAADWPCG
ncbi:DASH family cryptochrome [Halioxenophilus aromaticivorans]|uniref:Cryptochrome DASH n=1 Tax=Halioxenophilus aromaticivorans TaxID=1306992 RepID=A0AAV3U343_9ALTE